MLSCPLSGQRRLWSYWADAQADQSLCWAHMPFCCFFSRGGSNICENLTFEEWHEDGNYRKTPKYSDTQKIGCNHSKIWTMWLYHRVMSPNDAGGMAHTVDPDQTAPRGLIWVCTVCPGISVRKLRIMTVSVWLCRLRDTRQPIVLVHLSCKMMKTFLVPLNHYLFSRTLLKYDCTKKNTHVQHSSKITTIKMYTIMFSPLCKCLVHW